MLAREHRLQGVMHVCLEWLAEEDAPVELALKRAGERCPVRAHAFETLEHQVVAAVAGAHEAGVALLAAGHVAPHRGHEELEKMRLELDLEE